MEAPPDPGTASRGSTELLRKRMRELQRLSGEVEELARQGRKQARHRREALLASSPLDPEALCAFAARLRVGPPVGFPVSDTGLPLEPLPGGFWLPYPSSQEDIPKAKALWSCGGRAPAPDVEVLPLSPMTGSMESEVDAPGPYGILGAAAIKRSASLDSDAVGTLSVGSVVSVLEVLRVGGKRVRARIPEPAGWISLLNLETGYRWAAKLRVLTLRVRAISPATAIFYTTDGSLPRPGAAAARRIGSGSTLQLKLGGRVFLAAFAAGLRPSDTVTVTAPRPPGTGLLTSGRSMTSAGTSVAGVPCPPEHTPVSSSVAPSGQGRAEAEADAAATATKRADLSAGVAAAKAQFRGGLLLGDSDSEEDEDAGEPGDEYST